MGYGAEQLSDSSSPGADFPVSIDRYKCLKKIATGGMAELFLAKQSGLEGFEKVVVLKRILSNLAADEEFVSMFLDEARIAAKLSHPNIVQIYDLGKADDSYYIAMEYVSGRNVQHLIEKEAAAGRKIPVEHTCRIIAGVCDGLYYAHSRKDYDGSPLNIVHRDISPQNILVSFAGGVKVVDFGIAKASTQLAQTRAGVLKGKYAYMSPEQVKGSKIDHRADIFALGLVMYEMLTGTRAFERDSSLKTLKAIVQEKPLNPTELNPEVPREAVKLLSRALEKNPDRRYRNAQEMQLAIEDFLDKSPKKSNNIRLSKYLYDRFDDELNAKSGTMIVEGVGEVIVPTGISKSDIKPRIEEEIDAHTLSAALDPANAPNPQDADDESEDKTRAIASMPSAPAGDANPHDEFIEYDEDEEPEDKTIPAYDLEEYNRKRAEAEGNRDDPPSDEAPTQAIQHLGADDYVNHGDEDPTTAGVDIDQILNHNTSPGDQVADPRQERIVSRIEAMVADDDSADVPSQPTDEYFPDQIDPDARTAHIDTRASASDNSWEQATQAVENIGSGTLANQSVSLAPPMATQDLPSQAPPDSLGATIPIEAVGPSGNFADTDSVVPSAGGIRPAASVNAPPPSTANEIAPGISPPGVPPGGFPVDVNEVTPGTSENPPSVPAPGPAAKAPKAKKEKKEGGIPMAAKLGCAFIFFLIFASTAALIAIIVFLPPATTTPVASATIQINSSPVGADVVVNGATIGQTPFIFQADVGSQNDVEIKLDGYAPYTESFVAESNLKLINAKLVKSDGS